MSHFADYPTEFNALGNGLTCSRMVMNYVNGGAQERYTATLTTASGEQRTVIATVDGNTPKVILFGAIAKAANG